MPAPVFLYVKESKTKLTHVGRKSAAMSGKANTVRPAKAHGFAPFDSLSILFPRNHTKQQLSNRYH